MPPLTTGAPPAAVHAIHAKAGVHAKKASQHAKRATSKAPKLHPRRSTAVAKKATRIASPYRVQRGDNMTRIAARHHVSLAALIKANGIANPNHVLSGSVLRIPLHAAPHKTAKQTPKATRGSAKTIATRDALAKRSVPSRTQTKAMIERTARKYGVNPRLALGISWQESGWNQRVVSPVDAIGAMQVLPQSGEWASGLVGRQLDLTDTEDNITAGVAILRYLTSNATSLDQTIGGYYQGLAGVQKHGPYAETRHYIRNVKALMERL